MIRHNEVHGMRVAEPNLVLLDQRKNLSVRDRVMIPDDNKVFLVFDQVLQVLPEQRKWRIRDDDIRLLEQPDAFLAAEIAVGF